MRRRTKPCAANEKYGVDPGHAGTGGSIVWLQLDKDDSEWFYQADVDDVHEEASKYDHLQQQALNCSC